MKLCVVGNGPSAKGHGAEIDACDFVVRIKAWWVHGAEDAGERIDAWAWYGEVGSRAADPPPFLAEHWFTQCRKQSSSDQDKDKLRLFRDIANGFTTRRLSDMLWNSCCLDLGNHPSTGFVALAMAMELLKPSELLLAGFDSTTPDAPNYSCARIDWGQTFGHDFNKEKQRYADIRNGTWLGKPVTTQLEWIGEPDVA